MNSRKILIASTITAIFLSPWLANAQNNNPQAPKEIEVQTLLAANGKSKYLHVLVGLNVNNSLEDLQKNRIVDFSQSRDAVLKSIEGHYVKGAVWHGQLGQLSAYVTQEGLKVLANNRNVRSITQATDRGEIYDPYGDLSKIQNEIETFGTASVNVIPSTPQSIITKGANYDRETLLRAKNDFINSWAPGSIKGFNLVGEAADLAAVNSISGIDVARSSIDISIGIEGFYELKNRGDILSARQIDQKTRKIALAEAPAKLDEGAIEEAKKMGFATIIIHLKRMPGYTPIRKMLSAEQVSNQENSIKSTFEEIIKKVDPNAITSIQSYGNIASAAVQLKLPALINLYKNPDTRIERIDLNRPVASTALQYSTGNGAGGTNAQYIWNYTRGAGQFVAIIDSGVQTSHPMFAGKNIGQACFGTNSSTHYSMCPAQNSFGDSPYLYPNSGAPCGYLTTIPELSGGHFCKHGTHVAAIAAGRGGSGNKNGVGIDADLFVVNAFSRSRTEEDKGTAFSNDILEAMKFIRQLRRDFSGITINLSVAGIQQSTSAYPSNCDSVDPALTDMVAEMKSLNIAVVVSTGNDGIRGGISFPACISRTVKVAASNTGTGEITPFSNMYYPPFYVGQFFMAPGSSIESAAPTNSYALLSGTSMAAPHITGAFALIKAAAPTATVDDVNAYLVAAHSVQQNVPLGNGYAAALRRLRFF